ncbi:LiaI-LiaF-like domain-containing protein [Evansella tamaricis]|uniref:LiaI-LiaF-like transmembrane region domain-containing protein n=1 Tax=Evansella tamaricis TaxID=2069301 RepID=A0ABS6JCP7_9BACI|nr:DUF5668 domain-containing protein [Evansella tamaricis]MBU9710979.1 hypothetical protein [Evansella tamaricis]
MKNNSMFAGIILITIGLYFLLQQLDIGIPFAHVLFAWPSILFFIGIVLAFQGFSNRDDNKMFSGMVLLGLGVFFHGVHTFGYWSYYWGYFTLIVSVAFFMKYFVNKREGLTPALILLVISAFAFYNHVLSNWIKTVFSGFDLIWPILFIVIGVYFIFFRKR